MLFWWSPTAHEQTWPLDGRDDLRMWRMSSDPGARVQYRAANGDWRDLGITAWQRYGRRGEVIGFSLDRAALDAALRAVGLPASPPPPDDDEEEGRRHPARPAAPQAADPPAPEGPPGLPPEPPPVAVPPDLPERERDEEGAPRRASPDEALADVLREIAERDIEVIVISENPEALRYLEHAARRWGVPPERIAATSLGDIIVVRDEYRYDVRTLREEIIHIDQQADRRVSADTAGVQGRAELEIEAREQLIENADRWGLSDEQVDELHREIEDLRRKGDWQ